MIIALDLEGILMPEIWEHIAKETGIEELKITTRDEPDFRKLMEHRVQILHEHELRLSDIVAMAHQVEPFLATRAFLKWARTKGQVMIISDTFQEFADHFIEVVGPYNLFSNRFRVSEEGTIEGCNLRIRGKKERVTQSLKDIGFFVVGVGDSFNDISLLKSCSFPILYRTPDEVTNQFPDAPRVTNLDALKAIIEALPDEPNGNCGA